MGNVKVILSLFLLFVVLTTRSWVNARGGRGSSSGGSSSGGKSNGGKSTGNMGTVPKRQHGKMWNKQRSAVVTATSLIASRK